MSSPTSTHIGHLYGQNIAIQNPNSVLWCRLAHQSAFHKCLASSPLPEVECVQLQFLHLRLGGWKSMWTWAEDTPWINSAVCISLQKEDNQWVHLCGNHCTLQKRECAISWVKMKYNIWFKVVTGLSATSSLQDSSKSELSGGVVLCSLTYNSYLLKKWHMTFHPSLWLQ